MMLCANAALAFGPPTPPPPKIISNPPKLPVALDPDFQIRKVKLFLLDPGRGASAAGRRLSFSRNAAPNAAIGFEGAYRNWGAVTDLDRRMRMGHYMDFFWRAKRDAAITVRLEYQQERLRSFTQAREYTYPNARGSQKTEFQIIGDDYVNDGPIIAWRCVLINNGKIVAVERSYLWEQQ